MQMDINTKNEVRLSEASIQEYINKLELTKKQILEAARHTATRLAKEAAKDTYESVKFIPATMSGNTAIAYVRSNDPIDTYREFGTGIVGSKSPHVADALKKAGWKYDVNKHGEKGWIYPKKDGSFGWTRGQPAQKKFYMAAERAKEKAPEIMKEELKKQKNKA